MILTGRLSREGARNSLKLVIRANQMKLLEYAESRIVELAPDNYWMKPLISDVPLAKPLLSIATTSGVEAHSFAPIT